MNKKQTVILGGGTFYHIRNHLSLATPAFGTTAKYLHEKLPDSFLYLTNYHKLFQILSENCNWQSQQDINIEN